jgi:hypothetical protein
MKAALSAWFLISSTQALAQGMASAWFPMEVGNQWLYEHESRDTPAENPRITRWQTVETVTGTLAIPEGTVVLRRVEVNGHPPGGWLQTVYGESNYLIRNDCLYFLTPRDSWNEREQSLRPEYRTRLLAGDVEPEFCFPLAVGNAFGRNDSHGWIPSRVVGMGRGRRFAPDSVSEKAFDVVVHLVSADETHLWFEKGVGITGEWDWHNGTYEEYRVRLLRFQPASPRAAIPQR